MTGRVSSKSPITATSSALPTGPPLLTTTGGPRTRRPAEVLTSKSRSQRTTQRKAKRRQSQESSRQQLQQPQQPQQRRKVTRDRGCRVHTALSFRGVVFKEARGGFLVQVLTCGLRRTSPMSSRIVPTDVEG